MFGYYDIACGRSSCGVFTQIYPRVAFTSRFEQNIAAPTSLARNIPQYIAARTACER